jgi:hypothetical protein
MKIKFLKRNFDLFKQTWTILVSGRKYFYYSLLIVIAFYIFSGFLFGFTYESNDDPAFENCLRGAYWNTPISNFYFYYRGIALLFVWLYRYIDIGINWYGYSLIVANAISCLILVYLIYRKTNNIFFCVLFLMVFIQNVFLVSFTRVSIILSFASLLLYTNADLFKRQKRFRIMSVLLFLWAFLMRPNAGVLGFILIIPFLIYEQGLTKKMILKSSLLLIPLLAGIFSNILISNIQDKDYTISIKEVSKYTFPIIDYHYDLNSQTVKDKLIVFELQNWFFYDKEAITVKNLEHLIDLRKSTFPTIQKIINRSLELINLIIHKPIVLFYLALFLSLLLYKKLYSLVNIVLILYYLGLIAAISIFTKIEYRVIFPLLSIIILFFILSFSKHFLDIVNEKRKLSVVLLSLLIFTFIFQMNLYYSKRVEFNKILMSQNLSLPDSLYGKNLLLLKDPKFNFRPLKFTELNHDLVLIPAKGWVAYNKAGYDYQLENFGNNNLADIFNQISNRSDYLIVSDSSSNRSLLRILKMNQIKGYLKQVDLVLKNSDLQLYEFKVN